MNSINVKCNKAKWAYDECFNEWFRKEFIVEKQKKFPEGYVPCEKLLQTYKACTKDELAKFGADISQTQEAVLEARASDVKEAEERRAKFFQKKE